MNSNDNFVHETIEAAETYYTIRLQHEPKIKAIVGSFFGDLASMVSSDICMQKIYILGTVIIFHNNEYRT